MTISKKLSISIITSLVLVGVLAFAAPTHAGFFDWLGGVFGSRASVNNTPTNMQDFETPIASCGPNDTPSITILSPDSGVYEAGDAFNLTWESCNIPNDRQIFVQLRNAENNSSTNLISAEGTSNPNDGSAIVTIPTSADSGDYRVRIGYSELSHEGMLYDDISDVIEITGTLNQGIGDVETTSDPDMSANISPSSMPADAPLASSGTSVCNMTVLTPSMTNAELDFSNLISSGNSNIILRMGVLIKLDAYDEGEHGCGWGQFEGYAGSAKLYGEGINNTLLIASIPLSFLSSQYVSANPYTESNYPMYFTGELNINPNPGDFGPSADFWLEITEDNSNGSPNPDQVIIPIEIEF